MNFDSQYFRRVLSRFATGVVIATTRAPDGQRVGVTMNSFTSVSLDPPLILFSIGKSASSLSAWQNAEHYAVNILNEDQEGLSNRFARSKTDKWEGMTILDGQAGIPIMPNAVAVLECEAYARHDGGDHEIYVGRVIALHEHPSYSERPLLFFSGRYRQLATTASAHKPVEDSILLHGW